MDTLVSLAGLTRAWKAASAAEATYVVVVLDAETSTLEAAAV
jgi:hypothetical protein